MSNTSYRRTERYSRPPSLSTIGSNEEADFSSSLHTRQPLPHEYSISNQCPPKIGSFAVSSLNDPARYTSFNTQSGSAFCSGTTTQASTERQPAPINLPDVEHKEFDHAYLQYPEPACKGNEVYDMPERTDTSMTMSTDELVSEAGQQIKFMKTRYMWMLLQLDQIPWWHNFLAATSAWIVLAAYLVVPGTFTSFKNSSTFDSDQATNASQSQLDAFANTIMNSVNHLGLLAVSGVLAGIGALGCIVLVYCHWQNYVWLSGKIFQPMALNAFAGLLTTIVSVYTAQKGVWSITAKINAIVTGSVAGTSGFLFIMYNFWLLSDVKKAHREKFPVNAELVDPMKRNKFQTKIGRMLPNNKSYY